MKGKDDSIKIDSLDSIIHSKVSLILNEQMLNVNKEILRIKHDLKSLYK